MRKSQPGTGAWLVRAGLATAAAAVVVVAGTATPAFAANVAFTISPTTGPVGGGNVITGTGTGLMTGVTAPYARFLSNAPATCPAAPGTANTTSNINAPTVTATNNNEAAITAPVLPFGNYRICIYGSAGLEGTSDTPYVVAAAAPALNPGSGAVAGGNTVTVTGAGAYLTAATNVGALFTTANTCPANYSTASPGVAATVVRTSASVATVTVPTTLTQGQGYSVCIYNGTTGTSVLYGRSAAVYNILPSSTLSPTVGPTGGTNTITVTTASGVFSGITTPGVTFSRDACPATYTTTGGNSAGTTVTKISNTKVAVQVPVAVALTGSETTAPYNVCVYGGQTGTDALIAASATYTVAPVLAVTAISPAGGPAQGGSEVDITGTGFPVGATGDALPRVSIGGSPLTNVRVVSATSITGTTTAHAPGTAAVSVTTAAGTRTLPAAFTFSYGITVTPKTAPSNTSVYLDIMGVGFESLTFGTGNPTGGDARVFLVNDAYSAADTTTPGSWDVVPVAECTGVLRISDNEIICQVDLGNTLNADGTANTADVANGTYTVSVVSDSEPGATLTAGDTSIISSGSTFTVAPY